MSHDELRELAASYALDAVSDEERRVMEQHLQVCPECAGEVASLRATAAELAFAVPERSAPAALRARVLASIEEPAMRPATAVMPVRRSTGWPLAIAATLATIVVGSYALALRAHIGFLDQALRESRAQARAAQQQLTDVQGQLGRARAEVQVVNLTTGILASPDVVKVDLKGQPAAPAAIGRAFWSPSRGVVFTANSLPALPASRVYQLWFVTAAGAPRSAGLLSPDSAGRALLAAEDVTERPAAFAVTDEPAGGVPAPTGQRILLGAL